MAPSTALTLRELRLTPVRLTCRDVPASWASPVRRHVIVRLVAEDGLVGWGEMTNAGGPAPLAPALPRLEAALRREAIGADARDIGVLIHRLRRVLGDGPAARAALCGVDLALHDLVGRARGEPVHRLLGGAHRAEIRVAYAVAPHRDVAEVPASLAYVGERLEGGFDLLRCYIGLDAAADELFVRQLRETYNNRVTIKTLDCNGHLDWKAALRAIDRLREWGDFQIVESPARRGDAAGLAEVRRRLPFPVSEHVDTPAEALALAQAGAVDLFNVRCISAGGLMAARQVAAIGEAAGIGCVLGAAHELALGTAAQIHLAAALPPPALPADCIGPEIYDDDITADTLRYEGSRLTVPTGPGLGVAIDEAKLARYAVDPAAPAIQ
jgi:muconate cycloisomerase